MFRINNYFIYQNMKHNKQKEKTKLEEIENNCGIFKTKVKLLKELLKEKRTEKK